MSPTREALLWGWLVQNEGASPQMGELWQLFYVNIHVNKDISHKSRFNYFQHFRMCITDCTFRQEVMSALIGVQSNTAVGVGQFALSSAYNLTDKNYKGTLLISNISITTTHVFSLALCIQQVFEQSKWSCGPYILFFCD